MRIREFGTLKLQPSGAGGIHPFHEILYVHAGPSELQWMGRTYPMPSPVLILIPANTPHWLVPGPQGVQGWYMEADMQQEPFLDFETVGHWNSNQSRRGDADWPVPLGPQLAAIGSTIAAYEAAALDHATSHRLLQLDIRKLLLLVGHAVASVSLPAALAQGDSIQTVDRHIYTILRHMERSYAEPITLEELSRICNFTPSYIIRLFKEAFGSTPIHYLQELRLNAATCYLETTDLPIQDIAELTGFSNLHYFSRVFKAKVGDSPSAWRKKWLVRMPGSG